MRDHPFKLGDKVRVKPSCEIGVVSALYMRELHQNDNDCAVLLGPDRYSIKERKRYFRAKDVELIETISAYCYREEDGQLAWYEEDDLEGERHPEWDMEKEIL